MVMAALLAPVLALGACAQHSDADPSPDASYEPDLEAGWQWQSSMAATYSLGGYFDSVTGTAWLPDPAHDGEDAPQMKEVSATSELLSMARTTHQDQFCGAYADPPDDEGDRYQGTAVLMLLSHSAEASMKDEYSNEYVAGRIEHEMWSFQDYPDWQEFHGNREEFNKAADGSITASMELWNNKYAHLHEEERLMDQRLRHRQVSLRTPEHIRLTQQFYVDLCDIELPPGYRFPTPEEMEVELYDPAQWE
jgi:hypothetical protein